MLDDYWVMRGKCQMKSKEPNFFYPAHSDQHDTIEDEEQRRANYCYGVDDNIGCAVIKNCLEYALLHHEEGVWGGTSTEQRVAIRKIRRRLRIAV